jgi:cell division septal protein FtsQ
MRSKNKKRAKKKGRAAYRKGEKAVIFFKRGTFVLLIVVIATAAALGIKALTYQFRIHDVQVTGNFHLDKNDVISSSNVGEGEPLLNVSLNDIETRLEQNSWIKSACIKKQLPGTVLIKIKEAEPLALLSRKKSLYLMDKDGELLEKLKGDGVPFLPVIKGINPKNRKDIAEALKLVSTLNERNVTANRDSVEIGVEEYGLKIKMDGELIKVGYGDYPEKFDRWIALEPEIRKKGLPIKYVDLRFKDSVIIKPLNSTKGKSS